MRDAVHEDLGEDRLEIRVYCDDCRESGFCLCATVDNCLREMGVAARVSRFTEPLDRVSAGIPLAPALSINGRLVAMGTDLSTETVGLLLSTTLLRRDQRGGSGRLN